MLRNVMLGIKSRLASHLEIRDIRVQLHSQVERTEKTLEVMEKYNKFLSSPRSPQALALYGRLSRHSGIRDKNIYSSLVGGMKSNLKRLEGLVSLYEDNNHRVLIASSVTTINASAMHLAAIADFYQKMGQALVLSVSEAESCKMRGDTAPKQLSKYIERNFSDERIQSLGGILKFNDANKKADIVKVIKDMDDVEVSDDTLVAAQAMGQSRAISAQGFNYLNVINPTFWAFVGIKSYSELRLMYLDLQKEELEMLERRHQELAQLKSRGESDLATDKIISNIQDRIDVKRYDIKELEESMG